MDLKITWRRAERRTGHLELLPADLRRKRFQLTSRELYLILQRTCRCSFSAVSKLTFVSFLSFATLFFSKSTRRLSSPLLFPFLLFPFRPSNLGLFGALLQKKNRRILKFRIFPHLIIVGNFRFAIQI